jgi:peptide subunit release factor 1 (eRF1)
LAKRESKVALCDLYCPQCNFRMTIARRESKKKKDGHLKWLWCPMCKQEINFVEMNHYSDWEYGS